MSELKPCPFCGATNAATGLSGYTTCRSCGADGPSGGAEAWNRRAPVSTPQQSAQRASVDTLTDEQISAIYRSTFPRGPYLITPDAHKFARAILAWGSAGSGATDPVAEAFEKAARICDSSGHHWSGAPALAMFELAEKIRALAAPSPAPQGEQA